MSIKLYPWQDALEKALLDLRDRLPNGLLVYGPRGAGILIWCRPLQSRFYARSQPPTARPADVATAVIWFVQEHTPTFATW